MTKRKQHKCEWDVLAVEDIIETTTPQVLDWLPGAPVSTKPDTVVRATAFPGIAQRLEAAGIDPGRNVVIVSHKTAGSESQSLVPSHTTSADTTAQWAIWNQMHPGLPAVGVLMNVVVKTKEPKFRRWLVEADPVRGKALFAALQVDWHLKALLMPTRNTTGKCTDSWNRMCPCYELCFNSRVDPVLIAADFHKRKALINKLLDIADDAGFERMPWAERQGGPSSHGMSRYEVLNTCTLKHFWLYTLELQKKPGFGDDRKALNIGTGWHTYLAAHYRGRVLPEELAIWRGLEASERAEARRLYLAYLTEYNVVQHSALGLLPSEDEMAPGPAARTREDLW